MRNQKNPIFDRNRKLESVIGEGNRHPGLRSGIQSSRPNGGIIPYSLFTPLSPLFPNQSFSLLSSFPPILFSLLFFLSFFTSSTAKVPQPSPDATLMQWALYGADNIAHEDTRAETLLLAGLVLHEQGASKEAEQNLDSAVEVLKNKISSIGTTWPILEKIVTGYVKLGALQKARTLSAKILEPSHRSAAQLQVLNRELEAIRERDLSYVQKLRTTSSSVDRQKLLQEMLTLDPQKEILGLIEKIQDRKSRIHAYEKAIDHLLGAGSTDVAQQLLEKLRTMDQEITYTAHKALLHLVLSRISSKIDQKPEEKFRDSGMNLVSKVKDHATRVRLGLVALLDKRLSREAAQARLAELEEEALKIPLEDIRTQVLGELSSHYAVLDDEVGAFKVVARVWQITQGVEETILHDLIILQTIDVLLELDRFKECHQWAEVIRNPNRKAKAWQKIAPYHSRAGDFQTAISLTTSSDHPSYSLAGIVGSALMAPKKISENGAREIKEGIRERLESLKP